MLSPRVQRCSLEWGSYHNEPLAMPSPATRGQELCRWCRMQNRRGRNRSGKDDANKNKTHSLSTFSQPTGLSGVDPGGGNDGRSGAGALSARH